MNSTRDAGFTLIELSIVLVIIGLIVGGVLVGKDLIAAATIRKQISQIEKFKTAIATFRTKYNALPGDIRKTEAAAFGLIARGGGIGDGDGNGIIEGKGGQVGSVILGGETVLFWTDLSSASLISNSLRDSSDAVPASLNGAAAFAPYVPPAAIGRNAYIFAFTAAHLSDPANNQYQWSPSTGGIVFQIGQPDTEALGDVNDMAAFTTQEAYSIDTKMDDGSPVSGSVIEPWKGQSGHVAAVLGEPDNIAGGGTTSDLCATNATTPWSYNIKYPDNINCKLLMQAGM